MIRLTLISSLPLAILLLSIPSPIQAQGDTKVTIKDGSIVLHADGLDAGKNWKKKSGELRHRNSKGVLTSLKITEGVADRCQGSSTCGIDTAQHWIIQVTYGMETVTIESISNNQGVHLTSSPGILFGKWKKTSKTDEREFGTHGDGGHISSIKVNGSDTVNGSATKLCSGNGGCEIDLYYRPQ
jgi:hypothetical protein